MDTTKHFNTALTHYHNKKYNLAITLLEKLPVNVETQTLLAECYHEQKTYDALTKSQKIYETLLKTKLTRENITFVHSNYVSVISQLAGILLEKNELVQTLKILEHGASFIPNDHTLLYNIGHIQKRMGNFIVALEYLEKSIKHNTKHLDTYIELINIYFDKSDNDNILKYINMGIKHIDNEPELYNFLGVYHLRYTKDKKFALEIFKKALTLCSDSDEHRCIKTKIQNNIGCVYSRLGDVEKSIENSSKLTDINAETLIQIQNITMNSLYLYHSSYKNVLKQHFETGQKLYNFYFDKSIKPCLYHHRKIRIGFVSGDFFGSHPITYFVKALLNNFNKNKFTIYCYSVGDIRSINIYDSSIKWINIKYLQLSTAIKTIMDDEIDVLIDLSGHTGDNRMNIFSNRVAKVQLSYLGYPCITGLPTIDYFIIDKTFNSNCPKTISMNICYTHYSPPFIPENLNIPYYKNHYLTFCSFNKSNKINQHVLDLWDLVLDAYPNSILVIKTHPHLNMKNKNRVHQLELIDNYCEYINLYNNVDIALDTFPYSGTTTTCECLLMGTPVITLNDNIEHAIHQNTTSSLLINSGLQKFVSYSYEEYLANIQKTFVELRFNKNLKFDIQKQFLSGYVTNSESYLNDFETLIEKLCN